MAQQKEQLLIKWSRKERDMIGIYPNRNGRILSRVMFEGLNNLDAYVKTLGYADFRHYVESAGYDYESMRITFAKRPEQNEASEGQLPLP